MVRYRVRVEWDDQKAAENERKHGVTFEQATEVLADPLSITYSDPDHSLEEGRFLTFGHDAARWMRLYVDGSAK